MATVMPWVISLTFHVGLALIMMFVAMIVIGNTYPEQITVPEAVFSQTPGGVMNPAERQQQLQTPKPQPSGRQRYARSESKIDTGKTAQKIKLISAGPGSGAGIPFGLDSGGDTSVRSSFYGSGGNAHHIVYVVDRSGSMVMSFDLVRQEMLRSISRLVPPQDFHVILFTSGEPLETQPSKLVPANHDNKIRVAKFLSEIRAQGQTDPSAAMARALAVLAKSNRLPGKLIYLLTDGVFADNEKVLEVIRQANAGRKVLINTYLYGHLPPKAVAVMKQIAKENGGRYRYIPSND